MSSSPAPSDRHAHVAACVFPRCVDGEKPPHCGNCEGRETPYAHEYGASGATPLRVPADYKRDQHGRVSTAEMNRYLPRWRCSECGQWLFGSELHTLKDCAKRVKLDG